MAKSAAGELVLGAKDSASDIIKSATATIGGYLAGVGERAMEMGREVRRAASFILPIVNVLSAAFAILANGLKSIFIAGQIAVGVIKGLVAVLTTLFNIAKAILNAIVAVAKAIGNAIVSAFKALGNAISSLVGGANSHLGTMVKVALRVAAAITAAFIGAAIAAEKAWTPLGQTIGRLKIAGVSGPAIASLREFAREVRRATLTSSADVLELAEKAARLRVPEGQLKAVSAAAVGLASALGISASDAMSKLVSAMRGDTSELKNLIPALKGVTDQTAQMAIIQKVAAQGIDLHGQKVSTFSGLWTAFKNVLAENAAVLGEKIAPGIKKIVDALRPLLGLLESSGNGFAAVFNGMADIIAPVITKLVGWFAVGYAAFFAFGQTVTKKWSETWELVQVTLLYYLTVIREEARHFFTSTLPTLFNWFRDFGRDWVSALGEALRTAFNNLFTNLQGVAAVGWDWLKDGMKQLFSDLLGITARGLGSLALSWAKWLANPASAAASALAGGAKAAMESQIKSITKEDWGKRLKDAWTETLTEGFGGAEMPALPDLAGRQVTAAESALRERMQALGTELGEEFGFNFNKNIAGFNAILSGAPQDKVKAEAAKIGVLDTSKDKGKDGGGNNLLESRFLTRGPGLSPVEQKLDLANRLAEQRLAEQKASRIAANNLSIAINEISRRMLSFNFEGVGG